MALSTVQKNFTDGTCTVRDGTGTLLQRALRTHEGLEKNFSTLASDVVSDEVREFLGSIAAGETRTVRTLARLDHELCHAV